MSKTIEKLAWGYVAFLGMYSFHAIVVRPIAIKYNVPLLSKI